MAELIVTYASISFALFVLLGLAIWKLRPASSPLCAPAIGIAIVCSLRMMDVHRYDGRAFAAAMAIAGFAAFAYLEWRMLHRPAVAPWPRRAVWMVAAFAVVLVLAAAGKAYHRQWSEAQAHAAWLRAPLVTDSH